MLVLRAVVHCWGPGQQIPFVSLWGEGFIHDLGGHSGSGNLKRRCRGRWSIAGGLVSKVSHHPFHITQCETLLTRPPAMDHRKVMVWELCVEL